MTIQEIKQAVNSGQNVYWKNRGYKVINSDGHYMILHERNGWCTGLTNSKGVLTESEEDFYIDAWTSDALEELKKGN